MISYTDTNSSASVQDSSPLQTLKSELEHLKTTSDFLLHRVDSMQHALDQESFSLADQPIQISPTGKPAQVRLLLTVLNLEEVSLTLGSFLKALNIYLVRHDLVDLNDLQILLNPLLRAAFQKPSGLKKVPYGLLLNTSPKLFL
jgi:hypothetical protein